MKYLLLFILVYLYGCKDVNKETVLAGVYVGHFEHEYGINDDTLVITKANEGDYMFKVLRKTTTIRKENGIEFPKKSTTRNYLLEFDDKKQIFTDFKEGKIFIWNNKDRSIQLGNTLYRKL